MPAAVFRADYDQLTDIAKMFEEQARIAEGLLRDITQRKQRLHDGDWVGEAGTKFYQRMDSEVLPELKRLVNALHMSSQTTKSISDVVKQLEQDASGIFKKGAQNVASALAGGGLAGALGGGLAGGVLGGMLGDLARGLTGGSNMSAGRQNALDTFVDQIHSVLDMLGGRNGSDNGLIPSQEILDAVRQDLAGQGQMADQGWQQSAAASGGASGGGSGGGSGSGSDASSGAPTATQPAEQAKSSGGGGGGGGGGPSGGGSMGAGGNSQVGGAQGMAGAAVGGVRGGGGMMGGSDSIGSLGAAVMAGMTRAAGGAAPIAEVVLMVGASAGGLLLAGKGSGGAAGWASGQLAQSASSPIYRGARG